MGLEKQWSGQISMPKRFRNGMNYIHTNQAQGRREPGWATEKNKLKFWALHHDSRDAKGKGGPPALPHWPGSVPASSLSPSSRCSQGWGNAEQAGCMSKQLPLICSLGPISYRSGPGNW